MTSVDRVPPESRLPLSLRATLWWLTLGVLLFMFAYGLTAGSPERKALAPVSAMALIAVVTVATERRKYGPRGSASPASLFAVSWFGYLGLTGLGVFSLSSTVSLGLTPGSILGALWLIVLALILVVVGQKVSSRVWASLDVGPRGTEWTQDNCSLPALLVLEVIGWAATLDLFRSGLLGYTSTPTLGGSGFGHLLLTVASGCLSVALVTLGVVMWSDRSFASLSKASARRIFALNIPPLVLLGIGTGVKGQLVTELLPVGCAYLLIRGRIPWKAVLLVALYLLVTFGGIQQYRGEIANGAQHHGILGPVETSLGNVVSDWTSAPPTSHLHTFWTNVSEEYSSLPQAVASIQSRTPGNVPFLSPRRYLSGVFIFVPASAFTPAGFNLGSYVSYRYLGATSVTAAPATQPGDLYMSGGVPAVILGELAVGAFLGIIWRVLRPDAFRLRALVVYAVMSPYLFNGGLDIAGQFRSCLETLVIYGAICWIVFTRQDPNASAGLVGRLPRVVGSSGPG